MNVSILTIGDELLIGQIIDTNSAWLSQEVNSIGLRVKEKMSVADDEAAIIEAIDRAMSLCELVLVTGGLGPTKDDITKHTLCKYFNTHLVMHADLLEQLEAYFKSRGREINEANKMQAMLPENCKIIPNSRGTAQGMWFEKNGKVLISMPGVPHEMKSMFENPIKDMLKVAFKPPGIFHRNIITLGMGESYIAEKIEDIEDSLPPHIKLAYLPSLGKVRLRLSGYGKDESVLQQEIDPIAEKIVERISNIFIGYDDITLEEYLGKLLRERGSRMGTAESCTGGSIATAITSIPGSSDYYEGSVVTYSYDVKEALLGVKHDTLLQYGAVSEETVSEMAKGLLSCLPVDYGIAVSGIAGPGGGTEDKPVGTVWMAVADKHRTVSKKYNFTKNRADNIQLSTVYALNLLRMFMLGLV